MKNIWNTLIGIVVALVLASCAHQSKITASEGHIDGQQTSKPNTSSADIPKPVISSAFVPKPTARAKEQTYSVVVNEVPVKEVLFALARESKLNIDIHPSIQGRVTLNAVDQTLSAILERLAKQVDLTYKLENNVLSITPDYPALRTYKVDYVNMSRDTKGFIGAAAEISSTGQSASTGAGGSTTTSSSTSGNGANNSSRTSVDSESKSHFWENLEKNIKELLAETDKEVIIARTSGASQSETPTTNPSTSSQGASATIPTANSTANVTTAAKEREEARKEYKTLFAATVIVNKEAGIISVRATSKQHEKVQEFLDKVLKSVKRQVLIEATIVEVRLSDGYKAGIDWSRLSLSGTGFIFSQVLGPQIATSISGTSILRGADSPGIVAGYVNNARGILASVQLLNQFGDTKVLSSPKLMVLNNQTAVLKVVDNLVYFTVQSQQSQGSIGGGILSTVTTTPNTVPVGVVMSVTPQINDSGDVNINVRPTISSVLSFVKDPNPNLTIDSLIPQIQVRELESMLQVASGNIVVLGGLMQDQIQRNSDQVPGLAKLPIIGNVFKSRDDLNTRTELVIFLKPTVIPNASLESDELQSYKQYLPTSQLRQTVDEPVN